MKKTTLKVQKQNEEDQLNCEKRLYEAFKLMESDSILYYTTLRKMNILILKEFEAIGAVALGPEKDRFYLILREDALLNGSNEDIAGLSEHECGHILFDHLRPNSKNLDLMTLNVAQDLIINDSVTHINDRLHEILAEDSTSILKRGCFFPQFQKKYKKLAKYNDTSELTAHDIYKIIKEQDEKEKDKNPDQAQSQDSNQSGEADSQEGEGEESSDENAQDQGQDSDKPTKGKSKGKSKKGKKSNSSSDSSDLGDGSVGESFDSHDVYEVVVDENGEESVQKVAKDKQAEAQAQIKDLAKDLLVSTIDDLRSENKLDRAIGQLRGQISTLIKDMVKSRTDKEVIFNFVNRLSLGVKKVWTKVNPRYPYLAKGKKTNKKPKLVMVIDSSGSMFCGSLFEQINYQIANLIPRCEKLWIVVGDTGLAYQVFIKNKNDFSVEKIKFNGGGGTNLQFGWDFAKEHKLDGVIVHTDGEIPEFNTHNLKTLFFLYGDSFQSIERNKTPQIAEHRYVKVEKVA